MAARRSVGLGLALARPDRRVAVITGDGDVLMALGSLATIGVKQPKNLVDRRVSTTATTAPPACSRAPPAPASISQRPRRPAAFASSRSTICHAPPSCATLLHSGEGPLFIHARVDADDQKRIIPSRDGPAIKQRFMQALWRRG